MKKLLILFSIYSLSLSAVVVDLRKNKSHSIDVDMTTESQADIILRSATNPEIFLVNGPLASCGVEEIEQLDARTYRIGVSFEPVMDEGCNGCTIFLRAPGRIRRVNLNILVDAFNQQAGL